MAQRWGLGLQYLVENSPELLERETERPKGLQHPWESLIVVPLNRPTWPDSGCG